VSNTIVGNIGFDIKHIFASSWPSLTNLDLNFLLYKSIQKYEDGIEVSDNPTRMGCRYVIQHLTKDRYPAVRKISITVRDSRAMFIFFAELFKAVNNDHLFRENFIGANITTISIDQESMTVQEHWQYQHRWNQFMKNYEKCYKPFPDISSLTINHWLPSVHLLTKVIGTTGINVTISPGVEDSNLTSFLFDRWEPDRFPILSFIIRRRRVIANCNLGYFVDVDFDNHDINDANNNIIKSYRSHFQDEYQVDPDESYTSTITNSVTNTNIVSAGIYRTILINKFNNTSTIGFHEKFMNFLGCFDTNANNSHANESSAKLKNIIDNCIEMNTMILSIDRIGTSLMILL